MAFKSVCLIGASGNLGTLILKYLLASPQNFQVSVVARHSSTSQYPDGVKVTKVPDNYPVDHLTKAFEGIDVVVAAVSMMGMGEQWKFIDACLAAKVKRYFPTEFGLDELPQWLLDLREMFRIKHDVRDHLMAKESTGLEWTSICCNAFFEMGIASGFFQFNWKEKKVVLLDDGQTKWVATTLDTTAEAVVKAIEKPEVSKNRIMLVQDFQTNQKQILEAVQKKVKGWDVENVKSGPWLEAGKEAVRGGDNASIGKLTFGSFAQGNKYEGRADYGNDVLGLKAKSFDEAMDMFWKEYSTSLGV